MKPLFSYQVRFFPWLHVREIGGRYVRFLDLENVHELRPRAEELFHRLSLRDDDTGRMPRSRDLPVEAWTCCAGGSTPA